MGITHTITSILHWLISLPIQLENAHCNGSVLVLLSCNKEEKHEWYVFSVEFCCLALRLAKLLPFFAPTCKQCCSQPFETVFFVIFVLVTDMVMDIFVIPIFKLYFSTHNSHKGSIQNYFRICCWQIRFRSIQWHFPSDKKMCKERRDKKQFYAFHSGWIRITGNWV